MPRTFFPLVTSALFSGSYIAGKYTTHDLDPLTTTLGRYAVALAFLAALLPRFGLASLGVRARHLPAFVAMGLLGIVGYHFFFFSSLRHTEVANTAIINALSPVLTGVLAALTVKERLALRNYAGVIVALVGVLLLLSRGDLRVLARSELNIGDVYMLVAVCCFSAYALIVKALLPAYSGFTLTFYATLFGVACIVALVPVEESLGQLAAMSVASLYSILYMGVFASGLGYLTYNLSIAAVGATRTSSFVYGVIPIIVAVLALVFFDEAITTVMVLSTALVLIGLYYVLAERRGRRC